MSKLISEEDLVKRIMNSQVTALALLDPKISDNLRILETGIRYILTRSKLDGLERELELKHDLNGLANNWTQEIKGWSEQIKRYHDILVTMSPGRFLHYETIAELIFEDYKEAQNCLSQ